MRASVMKTYFFHYFFILHKYFVNFLVISDRLVEHTIFFFPEHFIFTNSRTCNGNEF